MTEAQRVAILVAVLGVLFLTAGVGTVGAQNAPDCSTVSYNGDGTEANPYEVSNVEQLQCIEEQDLDANYVQVSDIDASGTSEWNGGDGFEPIGDFDNQFTGTYDGADNTVSGLYIDRRSTFNVGLFGYVDTGSRLENVALENVNVSGDFLVGGLVGDNLGTVRDSHATGNVSGNGIVGGLVGINAGTVSGSYATGNVSGDQDVGGLVGQNSGTVSGSYATGDVSANESVGGLVGLIGLRVAISGGTDRDSYATRGISASAPERFFGVEGAGSLVGENRNGLVTNSYATGDVSSSEPEVGGLVGANGISSGTATVTESYATGDVSGDEEVGALVGSNVGFAESGNVTESYATGSVTGNDEVGGLVGKNDGDGSAPDGTVTESYWDTQTTGQPTSAGNGTGLTTSEMTGSAATNNMQGFEFTSTWETVTNPDDYPILAFQDEDGEDDTFTDPLPGFSSPPTNTQELDDTLYEDVDGDGDGTDASGAVLLWSELVQNPQAFDDLTQEQIDALDWNGDGQLTPADAVILWSEKVQAS
jgi:hypothetical protein